ncbi:MAG: hypothetical protein ACOYLD_13355 [Anaerohalosphaeraceae bacterium]|jgi:hypothetical protein
MNTNVDALKKHLPLLSYAVYAAAAILLVVTVTRLFGHKSAQAALAQTVQKCKEQGKPDEQKTKNLLAEAKKAGDELKKKNIFVPPPPKPNPPTCQGILGNAALFGDKLYKVGSKVGAAEIVSIGATEVVIKWEGKDMTLKPFDAGGQFGGGPSPGPQGRGGRSGPVRPESSGPPPGTMAGASNTEIRPGPPEGGPRGALMNMSQEERDQLVERFRNMSPEERERFREEQRQRFGERGAFGGGRGRGR